MKINIETFKLESMYMENLNFELNGFEDRIDIDTYLKKCKLQIRFDSFTAGRTEYKGLITVRWASRFSHNEQGYSNNDLYSIATYTHSFEKESIVIEKEILSPRPTNSQKTVIARYIAEWLYSINTPNTLHEMAMHTLRNTLAYRIEREQSKLEHMMKMRDIAFPD